MEQIKTYRSDHGTVTVRRPVLTEEERLARMAELKQATTAYLMKTIGGG